MIKIITTGEKINIYSPYSEKFVTAIKLAGARWNGEAWSLDATENCAVLYAAKKKKSKVSRKKEKRILQSWAKENS